MPKPVDDRLMWEAHKKNQQEIIDEGIWDRMKARGAGLKGGIKGAGQQIAGTVKGAVAGAQGNTAGVDAATAQREAGQGQGMDAKTLSLVNSHLNKISKTLTDFENDLTKLGMDPQTIQTTNPEAGAALTSLRTALTTLTNSFDPSKARGKAVSNLDANVNPAPEPTPAAQPTQTVPGQGTAVQ